jgi:hypothetical protein
MDGLAGWAYKLTGSSRWLGWAVGWAGLGEPTHLEEVHVAVSISANQLSQARPHALGAPRVAA